jgi:hypothetical protein
MKNAITHWQEIVLPTKEELWKQELEKQEK